MLLGGELGDGCDIPDELVHVSYFVPRRLLNDQTREGLVRLLRYGVDLGLCNCKNGLGRAHPVSHARANRSRGAR